MLERFWHDVRQGVRGLLRDRSFTAVAVVSIALGVGANSAIFSLVDQALLRQLPVRDPGAAGAPDLAAARSSAAAGARGDLLPHPLFRDLAAETNVFDGVFARFPRT